MPASFGDVKFTQENICKIVPSLKSVEEDVQRVQSLHQERAGTLGNVRQERGRAQKTGKMVTRASVVGRGAWDS